MDQHSPSSRNDSPLKRTRRRGSKPWRMMKSIKINIYLTFRAAASSRLRCPIFSLSLHLFFSFLIFRCAGRQALLPSSCVAHMRTRTGQQSDLFFQIFQPASPQCSAILFLAFVRATFLNFKPSIQQKTFGNGKDLVADALHSQARGEGTRIKVGKRRCRATSGNKREPTRCGIPSRRLIATCRGRNARGRCLRWPCRN